MLSMNVYSKDRHRRMQRKSRFAWQGSRKTPQFLGGVKIHGPQPRDYEYSLNKKIRRAGLQVALSAKVVDGGLHVIDSLAVPSHKTASLLPVSEPSQSFRAASRPCVEFKIKSI